MNAGTDPKRAMVPMDLLFDPDYSADPVWSAATNGMVSLDYLPISERLRQSIRAWARDWNDYSWQAMEFDDVQNGQRPGPAEPVPEAVWPELRRQQEELCERLRKELGDDWRVGLVSYDEDGPLEARRRVQWTAGGPIVRF